jgi:zinc transport system substrate-binding protein
VNFLGSLLQATGFPPNFDAISRPSELKQKQRAKHGVLLFLACVLTGCSARTQAGPSGPSRSRSNPTVVVSFYPLAFVAERLVGNAAQVVNLTPPGVEPHDLEVSPDQAATIEDANVVFTMGQGLQPSVEEASKRRNSGVVSLLDHLVATKLTSPSTTRTDNSVNPVNDPHVWLDPKLMQGVVTEMATVLADEFPSSTNDIMSRSTELRTALGVLDSAYKSGLAKCKGQLLITSHAAFGRLAQRYGLVQESIIGLSPEAEPTADRLAALADLVAVKRVKTVFAEVLVSRKVAETLARESGISVAILDPIESAPKRGDYLSAMTNNLAVLRSGLSC